jgi:hypothetical protein
MPDQASRVRNLARTRLLYRRIAQIAASAKRTIGRSSISVLDMLTIDGTRQYTVADTDFG